ACAIYFAGGARVWGWGGARVVASTPVALRAALHTARDAPGPALLRMQVDTTTIPTDYFLEDPVLLGAEFMRWLQGS
ncbi:MAG: hypothetical protein ACTHMJ_16115, partial [Thermomicrobiales bacterium]